MRIAGITRDLIAELQITLGSVDNHASQMTAAVNATKDENRSASLS
jgi:hypothetical protein